MNLFQIKICGITTPQDATDALDCGADAIGLNFYHESPRFVMDSVALKIVDAIAQKIETMRRSNSSVNTPSVKVIGVFVNMSVSQMFQKTTALNLDGIQLHGDEKPSIVSEISQKLRERNQPCKLVRAIRARPVTSDQGGNIELRDIEAEMSAWSNAGIDAVLLDAAVPGEFGGTGKVLDWTVVPRLSRKVPLVLAGGLNPDNIQNAIEISKVCAVDVASGVESKPGSKDRTKVSEFIESAKRAFGR